MRRQEAPSEMEFLRLLRLLKLLRLHRLLRVMEKIHRNFPKIEYVVTACELLTCMMLMAHWMVHTFSKVFSRVPSYIKYTRTLSFKSACEACAFFQVSYASDEGWVAVSTSPFCLYLTFLPVPHLSACQPPPCERQSACVRASATLASCLGASVCVMTHALSVYAGPRTEIERPHYGKQRGSAPAPVDHGCTGP